MSDDVIIRLTGVTREFRTAGRLQRRNAPPVRALDGVDLTVRRGERVGIVGESGSGKTTLSRLVMGLDRPTTGSIEIDGRRIDTMSSKELRFVRERLQLVFQDPMSSLDPRMRVRDIILEPLDGLGIREDRNQRLAELLDTVGLPQVAATRYPHQFSGGQRQRIAIARALAPRPLVLVADEPVSALDVSVRAQTLNLILDLSRRFALTLLFVSHDLAVVRHVTERVAVMRHGRIVELGDTESVYAEPRHEYTQQLLASVPRLRHVGERSEVAR